MTQKTKKKELRKSDKERKKQSKGDKLKKFVDWKNKNCKLNLKKGVKRKLKLDKTMKIYL